MARCEVPIKQSRYDKLVERAKQEGRSVEDVLDQCLTEYIAQNEQPSEVR